MFPIGTNLTQGNSVLFHNTKPQYRVECLMQSALFWLITGTFLVGTVSMMAASLLWMLMLASLEMTELGLTRIDREDGTWLVLDPTKTRLRTCTLGGRSVTCIKIEED